MIYVEARSCLKGKEYGIGKIKRRDIIMKSTLRKMKKYFNQRFRIFTNTYKDRYSPKFFDNMSDFISNLIAEGSEMFDIAPEYVNTQALNNFKICMGGLVSYRTT